MRIDTPLGVVAFDRWGSRKPAVVIKGTHHPAFPATAYLEVEGHPVLGIKVQVGRRMHYRFVFDRNNRGPWKVHRAPEPVVL